LSEREEIPMPKIPKCDVELGLRNIIDIELQQSIIDEVKRISYSINPKIWIGIKWLVTYVAFRPNELRNLKERHINVNRFFVISSPKEKKPKLIAMLDDDVDLYLSMTCGLPDMYFFRHLKGNGSAKPGSQFGKDYLYKWWKLACRNLGVEDVDLYGGTRHSTTTALSEHFSKDELRESGTMHVTNQAFERYMQSWKNDSLKV
jgi:integrase